MFRRILFAVALLAALAVQTPAHAQWGYGGYGFGGFGFAQPAGWYTSMQGRVPPYFALHPPVYYSGQIVRIPYGASPFVNPWGANYGTYSYCAPVMRAPAPMAAVDVAESVTMENEFYKRGPAEGALPSPKSNPSLQRSQVSNEQGLMIENPFYQSGPQLARSGE